ncbi:MAG: hypothetical protein KDB93_12520 [Flavobacteriales bacterium]|nr:hypothetical protein [Flavobacteriales bacterium]
MKWALRILVLLAVVVGGSALAWHWAGPGRQQWVKDQVKILLNRKPQRVGGAVPAAAVPLVEGLGVSTGDEPPFSVASGPWSMVQYTEGDKAIRPDLHYTFEPTPGADSSRLSSAWAHGGTHAFRMAPGDEYSPAIRRRAADVAIKLSAVDVGFWMWTPAPATLLTAVVTIDRKGKQIAWYGKDLPADTAARTGVRLNASFLMGDLAVEPDDILSVYLWKKGGGEAFIDDMDLFFHSAEVPGRKLGKPLALDSLEAGGPVPLTYAKPTVSDIPVDTARFRAGLPALPTTREAVPFGRSSHAWRFVPEEGLVWLQDTGGKPLGLIRPWSPGSRKDITHFDRVVAKTTPDGIVVTGFDVDRTHGGERIAASPRPISLSITWPSE